MKRILVLFLRPQLCNGIGPEIDIMIDNKIVDSIIVNEPITWKKEIVLNEGDHIVGFIMKNEDNTRFFDWGEDPAGEIRALHVDRIQFANDGQNLVDFDMTTDVLSDGSRLFTPQESLGIVYNHWGFSMYMNAGAKFILPVR